MQEQVIWQNKSQKIAETQAQQETQEPDEPKNAQVWQPQVASKQTIEKTLAGLGVGPIAIKTEKKTSHQLEKRVLKPKASAKAKITRILGNFLILVSIVGLVFTFWPVASAEIGYRINNLRGVRFIADGGSFQSGSQETFGELLGKQPPNILVPKSTDFGIIVEKIGANAPVIAGVNAANQAEYNRKLQNGVAHAAGTALPGETGLSFLFAHSVLNPWDVPRYNAVFYLLRELEPADRVVIFWQGRRFDYLVYDKQVVGPKDVQFLYQNYDESILALQTCDPPGTTWRRLIIFAKLASST